MLARAGRRLDWGTVRDLLFHLPRRYDDLRELRRLGELDDVDDGEVVSARVEVRDLRVEQTFRRRVQRTIAHLADETGFAEATWFGRRYIERRLAKGDTVVVSGRIKRRGWTILFDNPEFQRDDGETAVLHAGRIVPVYRLTAGLTAARLRAAIREALDRAGACLRGVPARRASWTPKGCRGSRRPSRRRTTRTRSRDATPPCNASPSTSCSRSRSGMVAAAPAARPESGGGDRGHG